jgi:hypothetical protein
MAAAKETGFFRGSGGAIWEMDLPLPELYGEQLAKRELVRVEADGSPYSGPPTPIVGGRTAEVDPKDAELQRLRERIAELEAMAEAGADPATGDAKRPALNASKADWVAYVVAVHGLDQADAEAMKRDDLVALYGGE